MLNQVTLVGRITADPELKTSTNGRPFCIVTLATTRSFKNKTTDEYDTDFIDVTLWGATAENCCKHVGKGSSVAIHGRLSNYTLKLPDEQTFRAINVTGERVSFIQLKTPENGYQNNEANTPQPSLDGFPVGATENL